MAQDCQSEETAGNKSKITNDTRLSEGEKVRLPTAPDCQRQVTAWDKVILQMAQDCQRQVTAWDKSMITNGTRLSKGRNCGG
jgi:hypothetical protein